MPSLKRFVPVVASAGLVAASLLVAHDPATAAARHPARATATVPTCQTDVAGVLPNGRLIERHVTNVRIVAEQQSAPLGFGVDFLTQAQHSDVSGTSRTEHFQAFAAGRHTVGIDVGVIQGSPTLTIKGTTHYQTGLPARLIAGSYTFYRYGVAKNGNLTRWTWFGDSAGHLWFGSPLVVARNMGSLRTLTYDYTWQDSRGTVRDILYGTTAGGALKQIQIPLKTPGKRTIVTLRSSGFASYTSVSSSVCNRAGTIASLIYIDKVHNRARWYTFAQQYHPRASNLTRRALVAPGANWHLHATF